MELFLSILPPVVAIGLCLLTKQVITSLFISVFVGGLILSSGNPFSAVDISFTIMKEVMIDPWNARYLVLIMLFGGGTPLIYKSEGAFVLTKVLSKWLNSAKRAQLFSWMLGVVDFFNSDINAALVGSATKDINKRYNVSTEKLAYILDSTASSVSTFGPVSDWIGYQTSLIAAAIAALKVEAANPYSVFLKSMPWNIYCALAFLGVPMIIYGKDFGPMAKAELQARKYGKLIADGDMPMSSVEADLGEPAKLEKATIWSFVYPLCLCLL